MSNILLGDLLAAFIKVMSAAPVFISSLLAGIQLEWSVLTRAMVEGSATLGMVGLLVKELALLAALASLALFLIYETAHYFLLAGIRTKRYSRVISDLLIVLLLFVFYYAVFSLTVYAFFNVILPVQKVGRLADALHAG